LEEAARIAEVIHGQYGGQCTVDQLAASLGGRSTGSGAFRTKISTAQMFGLIVNDRGRLHLTELGRRVVDENTRKAALAKAFLEVDLYRLIYEKHRGGVLPQDAGFQAGLSSAGWCRTTAA
jgi:hypothetical protein